MRIGDGAAEGGAAAAAALAALGEAWFRFLNWHPKPHTTPETFPNPFELARSDNSISRYQMV